MRLFLALNLPDDVRHGIVSSIAELVRAAPELSWVDASRLHLTVKFLGEQPSERIPEVESVVARVAAQHRPITLTVGGVGAFPNFRRARVVWMGIERDPRLELMQHDIEVAFEPLGFEIEARAFRPHLTLARIKHAVAEEQLRGLWRAAKKTAFEDEFTVHSVDVMSSELTATGAQYTMVSSVRLREV